jgi:hypothetical protein
MSYYIYKICCDDLPDFVYVGSTKAFRQRKKSQKDCNNENSKKYNRKLYTTIRENGGWDNWRMVIIEECGEITFTEARIKEEEYRVKLNANLNIKMLYNRRTKNTKTIKKRLKNTTKTIKKRLKKKIKNITKRIKIKN